jgi:MFS family permease
VLLAMPCICTIVSPPVWGAIADSLHRHKLVHIVCHISSALLFFSLQFVSSFQLMCAMMFIANFQMAPVFSLMDLATMAWTARVGGDFGKQRLYAAVGYGIGGYLCGLMVSSIGIQWCFTMLLVVSCASLFLLVRYIPAPTVATDEPREKGLVLRSMKLIVRQYDVLMLFIVILLGGVTGSLIDNYLLLYVYNLSGEDGNITGIVIAIATASELPFFFLANKIIARIGTAACVAISVIAYGMRAIAYTYTQNPWQTLPIELLHGITFGLLLAALTNYIYAAANKGAEGTMIGLISAFQRGIGGGIASLAGGYVYGKYGPRTMWGTAAFGICPLALLFTGGFAWLARRHAQDDTLNTQLLNETEEGSVAGTKSQTLDV